MVWSDIYFFTAVHIAVDFLFLCGDSSFSEKGKGERGHVASVRASIIE